MHHAFKNSVLRKFGEGLVTYIRHTDPVSVATEGIPTVADADSLGRYVIDHTKQMGLGEHHFSYDAQNQALIISQVTARGGHQPHA